MVYIVTVIGGLSLLKRLGPSRMRANRERAKLVCDRTSVLAIAHIGGVPHSIV